MTDTAQAPRVTRRRVQTRQRLLDAALQVVAEQSLASASIEAVCERAGYTRGAFYSNFASVDDLLVALFEDRAEAVLTALRAGLAASPAASDGPGTGEPDLAAVVARLLRTLPTDRLWYLVLTDVSAQALRDPRAAAVLAGYRASLRRQLATALSAALDQLARRSTTSVEALTAAVVALYEGGAAQVYLESSPPGPEDRVHAMTALVRGMTAPVEGRPARGDGPA